MLVVSCQVAVEIHEALRQLEDRAGAQQEGDHRFRPPAHRQRYADAGEHHAQQHKRRQPTLWWTEVPEHVEVGQVEHAAEALGAMLAQWPDRSRGAMLVVVVHVAATASDSAKQTVVERLGVAARATERFHLVNLGPLSPVSREDLRPWADDTHVRDHLASLPLDLDDLRDKLGSGLPMRAFVQLFDTLCGQSDR